MTKRVRIMEKNLQRQHERLCVIEAEDVRVRVNEGVKPVSARGHPGD